MCACVCVCVCVCACVCVCMCVCVCVCVCMYEVSKQTGKDPLQTTNEPLVETEKTAAVQVNKYPHFHNDLNMTVYARWRTCTE